MHSTQSPWPSHTAPPAVHGVPTAEGGWLGVPLWQRSSVHSFPSETAQSPPAELDDGVPVPVPTVGGPPAAVVADVEVVAPPWPASDGSSVSQSGPHAIASAQDARPSSAPRPL